MSERRTNRRSRVALCVAALAIAGAEVFASACGPGGGGGTGGSGGAGTGASGGTGAGGVAGSAGFAGGFGGVSGGATGGESGVGGGGTGGTTDASVDGSLDGGGQDGAGGGGGDGAVSVVCGDGIRGLDEECDDGNASDDDACTTSCYVTDFLATSFGPMDAGKPLSGRYLGAGRHPAAASGEGLAVGYVEPSPTPHVGIAAFAPSGTALASPMLVSGGSTAVLFSDPVLAAVPGGKYVAAWTDFGDDGDELGVAVRLVDPLVAPTGSPIHANTTTDFSQFDADVVWTGSQLIVAWADDSSATTGPDIRYRAFSTSLTPATFVEQTLSADPGTDGAVCLTAFNGSWAAAWRHVDSGGMETIHASAGGTKWTVGPHTPGPPDDKPALVELDSSTLLLVFTEGTMLGGAILDVAAPGATAAFSLNRLGSTVAEQTSAIRIRTRSS